MPDWLVALLGLAASVVTLGGGLLVAKQFKSLGGGEAQLKLNVTLKELNEAYEDQLGLRDERIKGLERQFGECKGRLERMELREDRWKEERIELREELAAVYRRLGMQRRHSALDERDEAEDVVDGKDFGK